MWTRERRDTEPDETSWWSIITTTLFAIGAISYGVYVLWSGELAGRRGSVHTGPLAWLAGLAFVSMGLYAVVRLVRSFL
jgi:hypothetical protein